MTFVSNSKDDAKIRRKMNKPLVEKKRRERINKYLYELHDLLSEADHSVPTNKLEKADILQMAVHHIRNLKQRLRTKVIECGPDSMSVEQMQRLGLLQQDPPVTHSLQIRIPSPTNSSSSTGYPSPTPSLTGSSQSTHTAIPMTLLQAVPQQRVGNSQFNMYRNTTTCTPSTPSWPPTHKESTSSTTMWRPW